MKGPKSLDRNHFDSSPVFELSDADAAATLCAFTAEAVRKSISHFQNSPSLCAVSGGGRKNKAIIRELEKRLETKSVLLRNSVGRGIILNLRHSPILL